MDWDLPDEDAVTVAGLVIHEAQTIPRVGQTFIFHRHRFQVVRREVAHRCRLAHSVLRPSTASTSMASICSGLRKRWA